MISFKNIVCKNKMIGFLFSTSVSLGKGRGQHAAIKMMMMVQEAMPNGPIRGEQVNRSSSVIG
jgi:hypothetical protein